MKTSIYTVTNKQKSSRVSEEKANYSTNKNASFTPWTWSSDGRLVRYPQKNGFANYDSEQECSEVSDLEEQIQIVTKLRQELLDRSSTGRKKEYLQSIRNKDRDLEYLRQRLELARSSRQKESPNSQATDESQPTPQEPASVEVVDTEELTPSLERSSIEPSPEETEVVDSEELTPDEERALLNPQSVEVVDTEELTPDDERDRLHLERKVERAFYEAGKALQEIRDRRLYRSTHGTFEEYCRDRFDYTRRKMDYLIAAATVVDNLTMRTNCSQNSETEMRTNCSQNSETEMRTNCSQILPTSENQVRSLTQLDPEQQREVWQQAVRASEGKIPSGRIVKDIVQRIMEKTKVPNPFRVGEVCQIIPSYNPDLRGKGGCWCIVTHVGDYSCTVTAWDGEYAVRMDQLKLLEYTDAECEHMIRVCDRITRLRDCGKLEPTAQAILKQLGELKRSYLTILEEKVLKLMETEYLD